MAHKYNNPVISELDDIASDLEKTGNADLASLVDEVAAEILSPRKPVVAAKQKVAPKAAPKASPKKPAPVQQKKANGNVNVRRERIASAMRKIAHAQVRELEDIAGELMREGDKRAALEVLKIAEDLESEYEYSGAGKHKAPSGKGDASKLFDKNKANKPDAKMSAEEKEKLETPFGADDAGYPLNASKRAKKDAAFDKKLEDLIRLASEDMDLDAALPAEDDMADDMAEDSADDMGDIGDEDAEDAGDEDAEDADLDGLDSLEDEGDGDEDADDMDLDGLDLGEDASEEPAAEDMGDGEDELAAMMDAMGADDEDMEASSDRMYDADADEDEAEEPAFGEEEEEEGLDEPEADEPMDEEASAMGALGGAASGMALGGPAGAAVGGLAGAVLGSAQQKQKVLALAKKLAARGEKGLAARVAKLAK